MTDSDADLLPISNIDYLRSEWLRLTEAEDDGEARLDAPFNRLELVEARILDLPATDAEHARLKLRIVGRGADAEHIVSLFDTACAALMKFAGVVA